MVICAHNVKESERFASTCCGINSYHRFVHLSALFKQPQVWPLLTEGHVI